MNPRAECTMHHGDGGSMLEDMFTSWISFVSPTVHLRSGTFRSVRQQTHILLGSCGCHFITTYSVHILLLLDIFDLTR